MQIKKEFLFKSECGNESFPYTCEQLDCSLLLSHSLILILYLYLFLFLFLCHAAPYGTVWFRMVIPSEVCLLLTRC